jgi:hypothetical protein
MKNSKTRKRAKPQPRKAAAKKPARKPQPKAARPPRRRVPQGSLTIRSATGGYSTAIEVRKGEDLQDAARRVLGQDRRFLEEIEVGKRHRTEFGDIEGLALSYGERGAIIQPIAITENDELIAGERRMKAWAHPLNKFAQRSDPGARHHHR